MQDILNSYRFELIRSQMTKTTYIKKYNDLLNLVIIIHVNIIQYYVELRIFDTLIDENLLKMMSEALNECKSIVDKIRGK